MISYPKTEHEEQQERVKTLVNLIYHAKLVVWEQDLELLYIWNGYEALTTWSPHADGVDFVDLKTFPPNKQKIWYVYIHIKKEVEFKRDQKFLLFLFS